MQVPNVLGHVTVRILSIWQDRFLNEKMGKIKEKEKKMSYKLHFSDKGIPPKPNFHIFIIRTYRQRRIVPHSTRYFPVNPVDCVA
jgi:hypothetical protein